MPCFCQAIRYLGSLSCALAIANASCSLSAADFYFSAAGNDLNGNGSAASPWKTITKLNALDLDPGDNVFFHASDVFDGSISLSANDTGTDSLGQLIAPISIGSYGGAAGSRATIRSPTNQPALLAQNDGGIELKDLDFVNGGTYTTNSGSGIQFETTLSASGGLSQFEHIRVSNVAAHGFHQSGLSFYAGSNVGYDDVVVSDSDFYSNQYSGIDVGAADWTNLVHHNVTIDHVDLHDNPGFAGCSPHCGHGIVLGQVDGAVIENSVARSNGTVAGKGNVGIWAWQSNHVTIQHNQAYGNRSPAGGDGGGFDLDGGVTNSVVQYNMSNDNDGAGFLLAEFESATPMSQNVFRYNRSVNDGRDGYGGITVWGATPNYLAKSAVFHNNTVVVDRNVVPNSQGPVLFLDSNQADLQFINNIFVALNGAPLIDGTASRAKSNFVANNYWTNGKPLNIGANAYSSIAQWSTASGQEIDNGHFVGLQADPAFIDDASYRLSAVSALIDAGYRFPGGAWPGWLTGVGAADLFGVPIPQGPATDVGAAEFLPGDYNRDGLITWDDYALWRSMFGQSVTAGTAADGNGNGMVDTADYVSWRMYLAASSATSIRTDSVPEPTCAALLGTCFALWWFAICLPSKTKVIGSRKRFVTFQ
jgi:hypothetical protein